MNKNKLKKIASILTVSFVVASGVYTPFADQRSVMAESVAQPIVPVNRPEMGFSENGEKLIKNKIYKYSIEAGSFSSYIDPSSKEAVYDYKVKGLVERCNNKGASCVKNVAAVSMYQFADEDATVKEHDVDDGDMLFKLRNTNKGTMGSVDQEASAEDSTSYVLFVRISGKFYEIGSLFVTLPKTNPFPNPAPKPPGTTTPPFIPGTSTPPGTATPIVIIPKISSVSNFEGRTFYEGDDNILLFTLSDIDKNRDTYKIEVLQNGALLGDLTSTYPALNLGPFSIAYKNGQYYNPAEKKIVNSENIEILVSIISDKGLSTQKVVKASTGRFTIRSKASTTTPAAPVLRFTNPGGGEQYAVDPNTTVGSFPLTYSVSNIQTGDKIDSIEIMKGETVLGKIAPVTSFNFTAPYLWKMGTYLDGSSDKPMLYALSDKSQLDIKIKAVIDRGGVKYTFYSNPFAIRPLLITEINRDVNEDGVIDYGDYRKISSMVLNKKSCSSSNYNKCDQNLDGKFDDVDARFLSDWLIARYDMTSDKKVTTADYDYMGQVVAAVKPCNISSCDIHVDGKVGAADWTLMGLIVATFPQQ